MRLYTVHLGPATPQGRDVALIKEGFCWPALFFTVFWALLKGLWRTALIIFALQLGLSGATFLLGLSPEAETVLSLTLLFLIGAFANDLQRFELARRHYEEIGVVAGRGLNAAALRAFERMPQLSQ